MAEFCVVDGGRIDAALSTLYCSPLCADRAEKAAEKSVKDRSSSAAAAAVRNVIVATGRR